MAFSCWTPSPDSWGGKMYPAWNSRETKLEGPSRRTATPIPTLSLSAPSSISHQEFSLHNFISASWLCTSDQLQTRIRGSCCVVLATDSARLTGLHPRNSKTQEIILRRWRSDFHLTFTLWKLHSNQTGLFVRASWEWALMGLKPGLLPSCFRIASQINRPTLFYYLAFLP